MNMHATGQTIAASRPVTMPRLRTNIYWAVSAPLLLETAVGAEWDLARIPYVREIFAPLSYPLYLLTAYAQLRLPQVAEMFTHLGFPDCFRMELSWAKLLGVVLLLAPVPARLKEWAYTGVLWGLSYFFWRRVQATPASA